MMDGRVAAIRKNDAAGFTDLPILSYAAKYCSGFYGPFREAAQSAPQFGDRRELSDGSRQLPAKLSRKSPSISKKAPTWSSVKPALPYLDIVRRVKDEFRVPMAAYNVSGEYSMVKAAAQNGWLGRKARGPRNPR